MGLFVDVEEKGELFTAWNENYKLKYESIPIIMGSYKKISKITSNRNTT